MTAHPPVLFLDVDGVLNSAAFLRAHPGSFDRHDRWDYMLDEEACARLQRVLERTGAVLVLSSAWRLAVPIEDMEAMLRRRGAPDARVIDHTPNLALSEDRRGHEIRAWLDGHPDVERFAIVDDSTDMGPLRARLVRTTFELGLQAEHVDALHTLLGDDYP